MTAPAPAPPQQQMAQPGPTHLIVLLHGVAGKSGDMGGACSARRVLCLHCTFMAPEALPLPACATVMAASLRERYGDSALVLMPDSYPRTLTYDGCDACAERVLPQLRDVVAASPSLRALSLLGYSFGGLVRALERKAQAQGAQRSGLCTRVLPLWRVRGWPLLRRV
jgi:hypothetical protein